jgi:ribulose-phosphate 3-epimerase
MIIPSILTDSLEIVQEQITKTQSIGLHRVQIDIIDPEFAEELTIHPIDLLDIDLQGVEVDIHLMTNDPSKDVVECSQIPGIKTIIAQIERMPSQKDYLEHVDSFHIGTGFSLDLYTDVEELEEVALKGASIIQVMGNKAGKQGQAFAGAPILEKISQLHKLREKHGYTYQIAVDIGMTPENATACKQVGADLFTPGSYLWTAPNLQRAIESYAQTR